MRGGGSKCHKVLWHNGELLCLAKTLARSSFNRESQVRFLVGADQRFSFVDADGTISDVYIPVCDSTCTCSCVAIW